MGELFSVGLQIAEMPITLRTDWELTPEPAFLPFLAEPEPAAAIAVFRQTDRLAPHGERVLLEENGYRVYPDGRGGFLRGFFDVHSRTADYALESRLSSGKRMEIDYLEAGANFVRSMANAFFHVGIEGVLIREKKICCHAALVETACGGILFSGPSGIGKSTQADLWCRLEGGIQLNGDRPILGLKNGRWYGWGSPYAGSSRCYVNAGCPVAAIVVLEQAPACSIRRLPLREAFRHIYAGLTVNLWDPDFCVAAVEMAVRLGEDVPAYLLACTPDRAAVDLLKNQLEKDLG